MCIFHGFFFFSFLMCFKRRFDLFVYHEFLTRGKPISQHFWCSMGGHSWGILFRWYCSVYCPAFAVWSGLRVSEATRTHKVRTVNTHMLPFSWNWMFLLGSNNALILLMAYFLQGLPSGNVQNYCAQTPSWHCVFPSSKRGIFSVTRCSKSDACQKR